MSIQIFHFEGAMGGNEQFLELEDDGNIIHTISPNYYPAMRGARGGSSTHTVEEAKRLWPQFAKEIDRAVAEMKSRQSN
jgi:hypothetical protein